MRVFSPTLSFTLFLFAAGIAGTAQAAPDQPDVPNPLPVASVAAPARTAVSQLADAVAPKDRVLYSVLSDQIREMRLKSALPAVMCLAENNSDGTAQTLPQDVMRQLIADNAKEGDGLFTLKQATACVTAGERIVDAETQERALLVTAGPVQDDMKGLMSGCGEFVGGFVRAEDDSDYDFYAVNGGDVSRKLGCEMAQ